MTFLYSYSLNWMLLLYPVILPRRLIKQLYLCKILKSDGTMFVCLQARDIYEEAIQTVVTVRDFTQVFDAYAQFEETMISAKMESTAEHGPTEEGGYAIEMCTFRYQIIRYWDRYFNNTDTDTLKTKCRHILQCIKTLFHF